MFAKELLVFFLYVSWATKKMFRFCFKLCIICRFENQQILSTGLYYRRWTHGRRPALWPMRTHVLTHFICVINLIRSHTIGNFQENSNQTKKKKEYREYKITHAIQWHEKSHSKSRKKPPINEHCNSHIRCVCVCINVYLVAMEYLNNFDDFESEWDQRKLV